MDRELFEKSVNSIEFFLQAAVSTNGSLIEKVGTQIQHGRLIVIRDAFQPGFARQMFECLDQFSGWRLFEDYAKHFHYRHHNIYDDALFPPALLRCRDVFDSEATKLFIRNLSGRDCTGETIFSASLYRPGDHSLPHNDYLARNGEQRQVAFVWNLSQGWQPDWGGEFFWCPEARTVPSAFNTLLLFNVERNSQHFVTVVAPHARAKRLAISGWWTGPCDGKAESLASEAISPQTRMEII